MSVPPRLSMATLPSAAGAGMRAPRIDPAALDIGIVHLGIGAFHRAHQAVYTEDALAAAGESDWGICGVTQRSAHVRDQLVPQDGLYTVLQRGTGAREPRLVGSVRQVLATTEDDVVARLADPAVRVVTLTVTEKGYRLDRHGEPDLRDAGVRADLAGHAGAGHRPRTVVGTLVSALARRRAGHGRGLSLVSCDNLPGNGSVLRKLVTGFCAALPAPGGEDLAAWVAREVSFPSTVVDRMVPTTRSGDRDEIARTFGVTDAAVVVAEPFRQWVVQDDFAAGRPAWDRAGALLTADVTPYEAVKLRLLNAAHSLLAYTGALAGHETIAAAVADPELAAAAAALMVHDASPTLRPPAGLELSGYCDAVLRRFANPALGHRTLQVAADGSLKLPIRVLGTVRDRLAAGTEPTWAALAVAAWMVLLVRGRTDDDRVLAVEDPMLGHLRTQLGRLCDRPRPHDAARIVAVLLGVTEIFGDDLPAHPVFRDLLTAHVARLLTPTPRRPSRSAGS
ncbi:fructuronate reductase [Krasilnikovia cinnamomea]|uniref:Fructuronate reductase n=1 Tax=Krasilnikovia cinnamomea TaxID=349313 RepID=A0A4Q7ZQL7_9ACTN|nr:mannitol dehydrogenase family protein [Krasilnikovia cinnamomea]RZU53418.1 fructuronate reductase [Krasilnikovia cinnamomea]